MNFEETVNTLKPDKIEALTAGKFGAQLATFKNGYRAVLKTKDSSQIKSGVRTFRGIPLDTVPLREVAFYVLAEYLGWEDLVPQTVLGDYKGEIASFQLFIPSVYIKDLGKGIFDDKNKHRVHALREAAHKFPRDEWRRLTLMDLIAGSRDRHGKNIIVKLPGPHVLGIDNSISFGRTFSRYRNIFHKYLFPQAFNFLPYRDTLEAVTRKGLDCLSFFLSPVEINHVYLRTQFLLQFPHLIPFKQMSEGEGGMNDFPPRKDFFKREGKVFNVQPLVIYPDQGFREAA